MSKYTPVMEARIVSASPLNLEKATTLASEFGVTYRSVIAKAKSMGLEYIARPAPARKEPATRKDEYANALRIMTGLQLEGIEKASAKSLVELTEWLANLAMGKQF